MKFHGILVASKLLFQTFVVVLNWKSHPRIFFHLWYLGHPDVLLAKSDSSEDGKEIQSYEIISPPGKCRHTKIISQSNVDPQKWVENDRVEICKVFPRWRFLSSFTILIGSPVKNRRTLHKWCVRENKLFVRFLLFDTKRSAIKAHKS